MIAGVMRWILGWVRVETEGGYPERLLNAVNTARVPVWGMYRRGETMRFSCLAKDYRTLRPMARRACLRMRVRRKRGLPFWRHRYRHRWGLLVGLALYVLVLALLAPRIWVIEVTGNDVIPIETVLRVARDHGVVIGGRMDEVDVKGLQIGGTADLPQLAFITVNPSHCVARVEVTEREQPPAVTDPTQPTDLVALRDGLILSMEVYGGQKLVQVGEAVSAGTRLVSGRLSTDMGEKLYRSRGEVWAETRRHITVSVPLSYAYDRPTGEVICQPTVTFFCWQIPLYSNLPLQAKTQSCQASHFLTVKDTVLPLGVTNTYLLPVETVAATRSEAQAQALAEEELGRKETTLFLPDSYEEVSRQGGVEEGAYVLRVTYLCRENIAVEVSLDENLPAD
ncbi:MAG: sporulation protein YqfD [Clostridia bacterium]|nr:sporulation protein YqfD [Clostridia bacterium]